MKGTIPKKLNSLDPKEFIQVVICWYENTDKKTPNKSELLNTFIVSLLDKYLQEHFPKIEKPYIQKGEEIRNMIPAGYANEYLNILEKSEDKVKYFEFGGLTTLLENYIKTKTRERKKIFIAEEHEFHEVDFNSTIKKGKRLPNYW